MRSPKVLRGITRLLCALIDYLILMLPVQLVLLFWIQTNALSADFLFRLLFAVYGVLMIEYNNGYYGRVVKVGLQSAQQPDAL